MPRAQRHIPGSPVLVTRRPGWMQRSAAVAAGNIPPLAHMLTGRANWEDSRNVRRWGLAGEALCGWILGIICSLVPSTLCSL